MIQHVYEKAAVVSDHVYVATDDKRIYDAVLAFGGCAVMTSDAHREWNRIGVTRRTRKSKRCCSAILTWWLTCRETSLLLSRSRSNR